MASNRTEYGMPTMTLEQLNRQELPGVTALVVYLSTISVTGAIGNILVIYIYVNQFKRSNSRYFILCLAFTDLFSSIISYPFEINIVMNQFTFTSNTTCKMSRLINSVPTVASGFIFIAIATDRYRKVCRPFGWQLSLRATKYVCLGSFVCSAIFSWPTLVLYGLRSFSVPELRENATMCSISDSFKGTLYPFIYNSTLALLLIFGTFSVVTMFTVIGRQLHSQSKRMAKISHPMELKSENSQDPYHTTDESSFHGRSISGDERYSEGHNMREPTSTDILKLNISNENVEIHDNLTEHVCTGVLSPEEDADQGNESGTSDDLVILDRKDVKQDGDASRNRNGHTIIEHEGDTQPLPNESRKYAVRMQSVGDQDHRSDSSAKKHSFFRNITQLRTFIKSDWKISNKGKHNHQYNPHEVSRLQEKRTRRISFLMFLITLAHVLSYLPHIVLKVTREINKDFVWSMSPHQRAAYLFFLYSYALNSVVNPFIYSACDKRFRIACRKIFRRFRSKRSRY